ncbi:HIT family protein [Halalkalibacterium halodurans]|nr:HIT family protein [Halalkalibacterium halodurans]
MLANKQLPVHVVYEDQLVCGILDHDPFHEGHTLLIPKAHVIEIEDVNQKTANAIMKGVTIVVKAIKVLYNPAGITTCQNGGEFNDLDHYHIHVIPREREPSFADFYSEALLNNEALKKKLPETRVALAAKIERLKGTV